jgi:AcrR family transcriptional regulator
MPEASTSPRRGRRAAASREDVLDAVMYRYLRGRRIDVQEIAAELGLGRTTVYRWFGTREKLIGDVVVKAGEPALRAARERALGTGGQALLETFDSFNRFLADNRVLRTFVERERDAALRIITSGVGTVHPRLVELISGLIVDEIEAGTYVAPVEPDTLGYAIVRLGEAFLFNDPAGMRGDVDRLRDVEAAILGVTTLDRKSEAPS